MEYLNRMPFDRHYRHNSYSNGLFGMMPMVDLDFVNPADDTNRLW